MSASWLQFVAALVVMYLVVISAGVWARRKRTPPEAGQLEHKQEFGGIT